MQPNESTAIGAAVLRGAGVEILKISAKRGRDGALDSQSIADSSIKISVVASREMDSALDKTVPLPCDPLLVLSFISSHMTSPLPSTL